MDSTEGLKRGDKVTNTEAPIQVPVGPETLGRIINVIGEPIDQKGKISKQVIKMKWKNWVDYWSVDFDFQSKQEILKDENNKEKWTGDYIFENEWQSFKTKEKKELEFQTPPRPLIEGKKIAVKVIDIFGNDTMKILEI